MLRETILLLTSAYMISVQIFSVYSIIVLKNSITKYFETALRRLPFFVGFGLPIALMRVVIERAQDGANSRVDWGIKLIGTLIEM